MERRGEERRGEVGTGMKRQRFVNEFSDGESMLGQWIVLNVCECCVIVVRSWGEEEMC